MKKGLKFLILISLIANLFFVSAAHQVSPTSLTAGINQNSTITTTVTNTDPVQIQGGLNTNITKVTITLPTGVVFWTESNATSASGTFTKTGNDLIWENYTVGGDQYLIGGAESKTFTFTANATTPGSFNMTITTTNVSGSGSRLDSKTGFALTISDTQSPSVSLVSPANNNEDPDGVIVFQCNVTENYALSTLSLRVWDNASSEIYRSDLKTSGLSNQSSFDYTFSSDGTYKWNCFANDTANNFDWDSNRTIRISTASTACAPNWTYTNWSICADEIQERTVTDLNSCNVTTGKPAETQACESVCVPEWDCTDWAPIECPEDEEQERTCLDTNICDDDTGKPSETRVCTREKSNTIWIFVGIIAVLLIGGGIIASVFYFRNKPDESYTGFSQPPSHNLPPYSPPSQPQNYTNYPNYGNQGYTYKY